MITTNRSGRTIAITRGVNLDRSNFAGQDLKGVAFQQSIVRDANFQNCNLVGASFFDATLDGSDFENAYVYMCVCVCNNTNDMMIALGSCVCGGCGD